MTRVRNPAAARMFLGWDRYALRAQGIMLPEDEESAARQMVERGEGNPYVIGLYRDLLEYGRATAQATTVAQLADLDAAIGHAAVIPARLYVMRRRTH